MTAKKSAAKKSGQVADQTAAATAKSAKSGQVAQSATYSGPAGTGPFASKTTQPDASTPLKAAAVQKVAEQVPASQVSMVPAGTKAAELREAVKLESEAKAAAGVTASQSGIVRKPDPEKGVVVPHIAHPLPDNIDAMEPGTEIIKLANEVRIHAPIGGGTRRTFHGSTFAAAIEDMHRFIITGEVPKLVTAGSLPMVAQKVRFLGFQWNIDRLDRIQTPETSFLPPMYDAYLGRTDDQGKLVTEKVHTAQLVPDNAGGWVFEAARPIPGTGPQAQTPAGQNAAATAQAKGQGKPSHAQQRVANRAKAPFGSAKPKKEKPRSKSGAKRK